MKPKTIEQMQQTSIAPSQMDDALHLIQEAVTLGYVATDSDESGRMNLERLLVTLLAAVVRNPEAPAIGEARAELPCRSSNCLCP